MNRRIGIDLDNTIIRYDSAFVTAAKERALIPTDFNGTKQQVRDHIRSLPGQDGETEWQKLQGYVYGTGIMQAELFEGVKDFLARAKKQGEKLYIVSHKTQYGHYDPNRINLRDAAKAFLKEKGLFDFLPEEHIFFAATRPEKLQRISLLKCDLFIDDLEEVFADPAFPKGVLRLLFAASKPDTMPGLQVCASWPEIEKSVLDAAC